MQEFKTKIVKAWGSRGHDWLAKLPGFIDVLRDQWHLTDLKPVPELSYNYVLTGYQGEECRPVVLKLVLDYQEYLHEIAALAAFMDHGGVQLLNHADRCNAVLLERVSPGASLQHLFPHDDKQAVVHAVHLMQRLHEAPLLSGGTLPTVAQYLQDLSNAKKIPAPTLSKALTLRDQLLATAAPSVLLHGDLHHYNILSSDEQGWVAIDPHGIVGEPAYEVGAFIRNPLPFLLKSSDAGAIIDRRLTQFAQLLNLDRQRLKDWSYVQAVLAAHWLGEDEQGRQQWLATAELIDAA